MTGEPFDLSAYLAELAQRYHSRPMRPLVNRREAAVLASVGMVEGRDFDVYPDRPQ